VALAALVGSLVMTVAVLPPNEPMLRRRLVAWARGCLVLLLLAGASELLLRAQVMVGGTLAAAVAAAPLVLSRTHFGTIWTWRAAALALLFVLVGYSGRAARVAACGVGFGVTLTTTLAGHAADQGDLSLAALSDWLHVSAAAAWTGGLFCLAAFVLRGARGWPRERLGVLMRRFSRLAGWCLLAVVMSGVYNAAASAKWP
jgi:putative copper resistance protein D